jgi:DNA-binding MarR family transcriptional regulator
LKVLHVTRGLLKGMGLTPARFDMMRIVELFRTSGVGQQRLQDALRVSAATVSRMVTSLAKLGYVTREKMEHDARRVRVLITELGLCRVYAARNELVEKGVAQRMKLCALHFDWTVAWQHANTLRGFLTSMRRCYGDLAPFEHPWTTDEHPLRPYHYIHPSSLDAAAPAPAPAS